MKSHKRDLSLFSPLVNSSELMLALLYLELYCQIENLDAFLDKFIPGKLSKDIFIGIKQLLSGRKRKDITGQSKLTQNRLSKSVAQAKDKNSG
jgi:hypothetical protein